jgi:hypothetical protein
MGRVVVSGPHQNLQRISISTANDSQAMADWIDALHERTACRSALDDVN